MATLSLGEYALFKNLGNSNHAAADLFASGTIMLVYAARHVSRETALEAFDALTVTSRESFLELLGDKK